MDYIPLKQQYRHDENIIWFGTNYNMNIYKVAVTAASHRRSECYQPDDFDNVRLRRML